MNWSKKTLALVASSTLALGIAQSGWADERAQPTVPPAAQTAQQSPAVLDRLVAPITLYPDRLVAQILAASVWPAQIVEADRWMQQDSGLKGPDLARAVDQQIWDPSVKGLTQFPLVLSSMDRNLSWSSALGQAYANQPQMVLDAIQVMRWRARVAGHLKSNSGEIVTIEGNTIFIEPVDDETVYLPQYDPWLVYGLPVATWPDWDGMPGLYLTEPDVWFGPAIGLGIFAGFGWGWHHWDADWHRQSVVFNHHPYRSHGEGFAGVPGVHEPDLAFAPTGGTSGDFLHGAFGARNHGFSAIHLGGMTPAVGASRGLAFAGGFHAGGIQVGGFGGGFHGGTFGGGGFHGGGFGGGFHGGGFGGGGHR
jgi:Protein of unknown function (DUF3300)